MRTKIIAAVLLVAVAAAAVAARKGAKRTHNGVPEGYRAFALPMTGDRLAFLEKGDRVDAMVTFEAKTSAGVEKVTATILQNVLVLGVEKPAKLGEKGVVGLILNPNEAQYLSLSLQQGEVYLAVRSTGDMEMSPMEMASFRKLFR